jgi:uncharacterized phage-like protein YoqJ
MKVLITGHRLFKLAWYDVPWIQLALGDVIFDLKRTGLLSYGYSGMASGVDLWYCRALYNHKIPYCACVPFDDQDLTMDVTERAERANLIDHAAAVVCAKNSYMVEHTDMGIVVWDGNKGGTANVVQQLVEKKKDFVWINPVSQVVWKCFK